MIEASISPHLWIVPQNFGRERSPFRLYHLMNEVTTSSTVTGRRSTLLFLLPLISVATWIFGISI